MRILNLLSFFLSFFFLSYVFGKANWVPFCRWFNLFVSSFYWIGFSIYAHNTSCIIHISRKNKNMCIFIVIYGFETIWNNSQMLFSLYIFSVSSFSSIDSIELTERTHVDIDRQFLINVISFLWYFFGNKSICASIQFSVRTKYHMTPHIHPNIPFGWVIILDFSFFKLNKKYI